MKLQSGVPEVASYSCSSAASIIRNDAYLTKQVMKLLGRIERILIPTSSLVSSPFTSALSDFSKIVQSGKYFCNSLCYKGLYDNGNLPPSGKILSRITNWEEFEKDLYSIISECKEDYIIPNVIREEVYVEKKLQADEEHKLFMKGIFISYYYIV